MAITLIALLGFSMTACDEDTLDNIVGIMNFAGTWHSDGLITEVYWFDGAGVYQYGWYSSLDGMYLWFMRGNYNVNSGNLIISATHFGTATLSLYSIGNPEAFAGVDFEEDKMWSESDIRAIGNDPYITTVANALRDAPPDSYSFVFNNSNTFTLTNSTNVVYTKQ